MLLAILDVACRNLPLLWISWYAWCARYREAVVVLVCGPLLNAAVKALPWPLSWRLRPGGGRSLVAGTPIDYGCGWLPFRCGSADRAFPSGHVQTAAAAVAVGGGGWAVVGLVAAQRWYGDCHSPTQVLVGAMLGYGAALAVSA